MLISQIRRTALAAAVAFSLPAAGQSDAALSFPLGAMRAPFATMAQLKTQTQMPAATQIQGPIAPASIWAKILDTVKRNGEMRADPPFVRQSLTETIKTSPTTSVHEIIIFLAPGADTKLSLVGAEISIVENTLTLSSGTILTESWALLLDNTGRLDTAVYSKRVDVAGKEPVSDPPMVLDLADPRVKARFDEMLKFWSTR